MASGNDGVLSSNFEKNSTNYNNNDSEISAETMSVDQSKSSSNAERKSVTGSGDYRNIRATAIEGQTSDHQPRREENPFSFKHFLNRDSLAYLGSTSNSNSSSNNVTPSTASSTISNETHMNSCSNNNTSTDDVQGSAGHCDVDIIKTQSCITSPSKTASLSTSTSTSYKTSTGARPKVPQSSVTANHPLPSTSASTVSMSSLVGETSKMKRSPRFSSFDSQASLAEYAGNDSSTTNTYRDDGHVDRELNRDQEDNLNFFFPQDYQDHHVPRSYSNYDMELPPDIPGERHMSSPRRRHSPPMLGGAGNVQQQSDGPHFNKNPKSSSGGGVLPDFVQDHIIDSWYYNEPINSVDFVEDLPDMSNPTEKCQALPDFLSDGPIIHSSSSHLADVAAGLPADLDSPEDNSPSLQIARLRLENDRLRRELDESRLGLAEQARRASELERRLEHVRSNESAYNRTLAQSMGQVEENLDQTKKRAAVAQTQVAKLKQQVKQLTAEVDSLRRENESLREEGAVGGDRISRRPSRSQQLSRDLLRAASNAENNLRQLLSGVENLRLMASTIENMDRIGYDSNNAANPIINEETFSDCDVDFDDCTGPAL